MFQSTHSPFLKSLPRKEVSSRKQDMLNRLVDRVFKEVFRLTPEIVATPRASLDARTRNKIDIFATGFRAVLPQGQGKLVDACLQSSEDKECDEGIE